MGTRQIMWINNSLKYLVSVINYRDPGQSKTEGVRSNMRPVTRTKMFTYDNRYFSYTLLFVFGSRVSISPLLNQGFKFLVYIHIRDTSLERFCL